MPAAFISYATGDRRQALGVCEALERRGIDCWIACRDVQLGENYQEAIVGALRGARAMVLVFSRKANASDEIKKELSLASRHRIPVMTLRLEDVEPSDAFAYELATRQWIDLFAGREAAIATLARRIAEVATPGTAPAAPSGARHMLPSITRWRALLAGGAVLFAASAVGGWFALRPSAPVAKSITVRLTGFERASPDVPPALADGLRDEIAAAFSNDGLVKVSTAAAPPPGSAPAYTLGGTVRRDGDSIRVVARLSDDRSGVSLWTNGFAYPAATADAAPRRFAIDAGNLVRCGLFGASTYPGTLPDAALSDYLQVCDDLGYIDDAPTKARDFAQRVVAAVPDFSWGWSGIASADFVAIFSHDDLGTPDVLRREGLAAAATALKLDPTNSEALLRRSQLLPARDLAAREAALRSAVGARPLACGCEHDTYGDFLAEVGRIGAAAAEYQRAVDVWSLNNDAQESLAATLILTGHAKAAQSHLDAAIELSGEPKQRDIIATFVAPATGDYAAGIAALGRHAPPDPAVRDAWIGAFQALANGSAPAKAAAAARLVALTGHFAKVQVTANLLGALGDNAAALKIVAGQIDAGTPGARGWLFYPTLRGAWRSPDFAPLAARAGLVDYWRATHTSPDMCGAAGSPPVCRSI